MTFELDVVKQGKRLPLLAAGVDASLLAVDRLSVRFGTHDQPLGAVDRASFEVRPGETVCLVGESGSGKTVTALSILRLEEQKRGKIVHGQIRFDGQGLVGLSTPELDALRGRRIAMIFQEPMSAFDPVFSIGEQITETILKHERISRAAARARALELLERVQISDAALRLDQIPQQLSGGMRQRAMIALALACSPDLLIADEPTTALDMTIQAQILTLLKDLQRRDGLSILLITHDLGVAAEMADRVVVMYAGRIVEQGPAAQLFTQPGHPYTRALLQCAIPDGDSSHELPAIAGAIPRLDAMPRGCRFHPRCPNVSQQCQEEAPPLLETGVRSLACFHPVQPEAAVVAVPALQPAAARVREPAAVLIETRHLSKHFASRLGLFRGGATVRALDDVSLQIERGETFGLVGESGCGKSTLGRVLLQLEPQTSGQIAFEGRVIDNLRGRERKAVRREMQMIFQDPFGSIDPRWRVGDVIAEPLVSHEHQDRKQREQRVDELLELVGLPATTRTRYAHEFSGGQRQRIGIARAIALRPKFIVADEAVSALDLSVQAQIINLLAGLRERLGLTSLFIGHGLHVVRHLSDRIGVMYLGRLVEVAPADALFRAPAHHYTHALLAAIPGTDPRRRRELHAPIGELPSPTAPPSGCHFHPRCPAATARCKTEAPSLQQLGTRRTVACHHPRS